MGDRCSSHCSPAPPRAKFPGVSTLRVAVSQLRPKKADYAENLRRVGAVLQQVAGMDQPPELVVFPEAAMSGYFLEGGVREVAVTAGTLFRDLAGQHDLAGAPSLDIVMGFYEEFESRYHNAALYATLGGADPGIRHVHRKIFLPTYGLFDEHRFVEPGHSIRAFDTRWGRMAMLVCEDAWHSLVGTLAALDGARALVVCSAAPARGIAPDPEARAGAALPTSVRRWQRILRRMADEHGVYVIQSQLAGFEGGKGMQGCSTVVAPDGSVQVQGPMFDEALLVTTLESAALTRARAAAPLLADLETEFHVLVRGESARGDVVRYGPADECPRAPKPAQPAGHPLVTDADAGDPLALDPSLTERWLVTFLRDEIVTRRGFARVVVGVSGGVDSAVTAALAVRALGAENVVGVTMPYRTSSKQSGEHARLVAKQLGIELVTVDISDAVDGYIAAADTRADAARRGNVMARLRMITLFDFSKRLDALPLGTGNKSERLLGYFTWHADDAPPINPLGDLFKTQVRALAAHLNVPDDIVRKPATADLVRGQTDEGDLGIAYERADRILFWLVKGHDTEAIVRHGFTWDEVALVSRRLNSTHWKRRPPTVAMVSDSAIGDSYLRPVDY